MKTLKKLSVFSLCSVAAIVLSSCGEQPVEEWKDVDPTWKSGVTQFALNQDTALAAGFASLADPKANGPEKDGYYEYGGQKFKVNNTFKSIYQTEVQKERLNYLVNQWAYNNEKYCNMVSGLVENNQYGAIVGDLAVGYKVEFVDMDEDGTDDAQKYTFQLRKGMPWITNDGNEIVGEVTAQDFVDALKYVLTPGSKSQTAGIVTSQIWGAEDYFNAEKVKAGDGDFSKVGIKAIDKYTIEYTTNGVMPYFLSCLTYSPYLPVLGSFLKEMGSEFGYSENDILVNGSYRMTKHVRNNVIVFTRNAGYWDKAHCYAKQVQLKFYEASVNSSSTTREWFEAGEIDSFTVSNADKEGWSKYVTGGEGGTGSVSNPASSICNGVESYGDRTFCGYFNYDRTAYDSNKTKTPAQKAATTKAVRNANFRLGFLYGVNALEYLKSMNEQEPWQRLNRGWTNYDLCAAGGKDYCDYVSDVYNRENELTGANAVSLTGVVQKGDPIYNVQKSVDYFKAAKAELLQNGLTEQDFPIIIDCIGDTQVDTHAYELAEMSTLMNNTEIKAIMTFNYVVPADSTEETLWTTTTSDYDFNMLTGWGPDYADPQTYCACWRIDGDMVNNCGLDGNAALQQEILGSYDALYQVAAAITDPTKTVDRYKAFAEAEYHLIYELGIIVPWYSNNGTSAVVARTVAHQSGTASYGLTADKYKGVVVTTDTITKEQRSAIDAAWKAGKN